MMKVKGRFMMDSDGYIWLLMASFLGESKASRLSRLKLMGWDLKIFVVEASCSTSRGLDGVDGRVCGRAQKPDGS